MAGLVPHLDGKSTAAQMVEITGIKAGDDVRETNISFESL
jgi:hypothetical protein